MSRSPLAARGARTGATGIQACCLHTICRDKLRTVRKASTSAASAPPSCAGRQMQPGGQRPGPAAPFRQ
ncbi:hypothetical protein IV454_15265 [Massilia antarctica]|uniref:Uncharacterized protein n=1 Tax=Massilia antarctica TaxID=2765360 RepID=A0AA48WKN3_9BURK|nr:hypothetical protein [Massilia antarctica]QPI52720.1 hypothetical protein IV454_15265 [Massilia antarctica]